MNCLNRTIATGLLLLMGLLIVSCTAENNGWVLFDKKKSYKLGKITMPKTYRYFEEDSVRYFKDKRYVRVLTKIIFKGEPSWTGINLDEIDCVDILRRKIQEEFTTIRDKRWTIILENDPYMKLHKILCRYLWENTEKLRQQLSIQSGRS